jgi:hypothetical protein
VLLICTILIFISARRAFWLVCLFSPFFIILLLKLIKVDLRLNKLISFVSIFVIIGFIFTSYLALDNNNIVTQFESSFEFDNPEAQSNYLRKEQFEALINGWKDNKLIGAGLGASAKGSVRDEKSTWSYELSYVALLFHVGIVGVLIYGISVFWIIYESIIMCRKNHLFVVYLLPQITSMICFLLVNSSNPYLSKFDYLWVIF